jgi:hypothetical protein
MEKEAFDPVARRKRREERRAKYVALLGGKCVECGSTKDLQFDHINKHEKELDIAHSIDTKEDVLLNEVKKCQLLCPECHLKKTKESWDWGVPKPEHGTIWMYKKYRCRCDECKKAMSEYYYSRKLSAAIDIFETMAKQAAKR